MDGSSLLLLLLLGHVDRTVLQLCDVKLQPSVQQLAQTLDGIPAEGLGILYGKVYLEAGVEGLPPGYALEEGPDHEDHVYGRQSLREALMQSPRNW